MHRPRDHAGKWDRARIEKRVTRMLKANRVTEEEASRVLSATDADELDEAVGAIRLRHVSAKIHRDVSEGRMTKQEADAFLRRVERGEKPDLLLARRRRNRQDGGEPASEAGDPGVEGR